MNNILSNYICRSCLSTKNNCDWSLRKVACLDFKVSEDKDGYAIYTISNSSDIPFSIDFSVGYHPVTVGPRQSVRLEIGDGEVLTFKNCFLSKSVFYSASIDELK